MPNPSIDRSEEQQDSQPMWHWAVLAMMTRLNLKEFSFTVEELNSFSEGATVAVKKNNTVTIHLMTIPEAEAFSAAQRDGAH